MRTSGFTFYKKTIPITSKCKSYLVPELVLKHFNIIPPMCEALVCLQATNKWIKFMNN